MDTIGIGTEFVEGADAETRSGPELVLGEGLGDVQGGRVNRTCVEGGAELRGGDWALAARGRRPRELDSSESEGVEPAAWRVRGRGEGDGRQRM